LNKEAKLNKCTIQITILENQVDSKETDLLFRVLAQLENQILLHTNQPMHQDHPIEMEHQSNQALVQDLNTMVATLLTDRVDSLHHQDLNFEVVVELFSQEVVLLQTVVGDLRAER
jgi:hypothetical protein